jgi:hypothetical protein
MNTIIINGKKIEFSGNAVIDIKRDTYEKNDTISDDFKTIIIINGNLNEIKCDNSNFIINGNVGKALTLNGNIKCNNIIGSRVVCNSLETSNIEGIVYTNNDIITNKFIGNSYNMNVKDNFKSIKDKKDLKEGLIIYHKKYGKGKINNVYSYSTSGSIRVKFDSESYEKTLFVDSILSNKSISIKQSKIILNEFNEEYEN